MKCRVCGEELLKDNNRCTKCGFNNEPYIIKEVEKVNKDILKNEEIKKETSIEKENDISFKLLIISIMVYLYFKYGVGSVMDSFGTYHDEGTGPSMKEALIVFSLSIPAIITQIICYSKYLKNKFHVRFLSRLAVKFVYLYSLNMIFFSFFGVVLIWLYIMFMPLTLAAIIIVIIS